MSIFASNASKFAGKQLKYVNASNLLANSMSIVFYVAHQNLKE